LNVVGGAKKAFGKRAWRLSDEEISLRAFFLNVANTSDQLDDSERKKD
jgi:hypothetical protein